MILLDVGVWLAATWEAHKHHQMTTRWFDDQTDDLLLCRVTQSALLRLLSNPSVMGEDVVTRSAAWRIVDQLWADERVLWADEPPLMEPVWRAFSARNDNSHKLWTDDYLAAFAQRSDATFATLDLKVEARYPSVRVQTIS